jgi:hypothetical protein
MEPINFTPYMDDCLRILQEEREAPTDAHLIQLVRVQLIHNKVVSLDNIPISVTAIPPYTSGDFQTQTLVAQLEDLKNSIPETVISNGKCSFYIAACQIANAIVSRPPAYLIRHYC